MGVIANTKPMMRSLTKSMNLFGVLSVCLYAATSIPALAVEPFTLNWGQRDATLNGSADFSCNRGADAGGGFGGGPCNTAIGFNNVSDPDKSPFLQEVVTGADGNSYFHMIIGGVDSGGNPIVPSAANESTIPFAQEVFIRQQSGSSCVAVNCSFSGGNIQGFSSGGGNGYDPLANNMSSGSTGNRSGFPTRVIIKEVLNDGDFSQVFLKDKLAQKPKITQDITASDISVLYELDMSNSAYNSNATAGIMTNKVTLLGVNAGILGNFDVNGPDNSFVTANAQAGKTNITGGRYTFVEGSAGDSDTFGQGTYTYLSGDDAATNLDWDAFRNDAQNPLKYGTTTSVRKRSGDICKTSTAGSIPAGC